MDQASPFTLSAKDTEAPEPAASASLTLAAMPTALDVPANDVKDAKDAEPADVNSDQPKEKDPNMEPACIEEKGLMKTPESKHTPPQVKEE